jgi:hypothetical protein
VVGPVEGYFAAAGERRIRGGGGRGRGKRGTRGGLGGELPAETDIVEYRKNKVRRRRRERESTAMFSCKSSRKCFECAELIVIV